MDLIRTEADRRLLQVLRDQIDKDWPVLLRYIDDGLSDVSVMRFKQAGLLRELEGGAYEIIVDELDKLTESQPETPAGPALLKATDPEARAYRERNSWCDKHFASSQYNITPQQLHRASQSEKGLYGVSIAKKKAEHGLLVYQAADLKRLSDAIDKAREEREERE